MESRRLTTNWRLKPQRNRSVGRQYPRRGGAGAQGGDGAGDEVERMDPLLLAGRADREDALGVTKPGFALAAEAVLPPQHGLAQRAFGRVVGRLDRLVEEGPQRYPQLQQVAAHACDPVIDRLRAALDQTPEGGLDAGHPAFQLVPRQVSFPVASPPFEDPVADLLSLCRELLRLAAPQRELPEVPDQVRPAELPFRAGLVRTPPVAADDSREVAQELLQFLLSPAAPDPERRRPVGHSHPQPHLAAAQLPRRLVHARPPTRP